VKQAESDQIFNAMKEKNIPVSYFVFPDEGHGFVRPQNKIASMALVEKFLAEHLGGRLKNIQDEIDQSSALQK
jgi:dipeptidyl aminopeptidase/acylaminoacyl peptidase